MVSSMFIPGILPNYRGCTCVEWALHEEGIVGNSAHWMTEGIDEGPLIEIRKLRSSPKPRSYQDIRAAVFSEGIALIADVMEKLANRTLTKGNATHQDEGRYYEVMPEKLQAQLQTQTYQI